MLACLRKPSNASRNSKTRAFVMFSCLGIISELSSLNCLYCGGNPSRFVDSSHFLVLWWFSEKACFCAGRAFARDFGYASSAQALNLKFENLNTTTSKKKYDMRDISSILYNLGSFYNFPGTFKNRENLCRVRVGGRGVNPSSLALKPTPQYRPFCPTPCLRSAP